MLGHTSVANSLHGACTTTKLTPSTDCPRGHASTRAKAGGRGEQSPCPVVPGSAALPSFAGLSSYRNDRPLTRLYQPPPRREPQWLCSVRLVDAKGRVIDRALLPALGWNLGLELGWTLESHAVAVGRFGNPELWITAAGDLRLPARF